MALAYKAQHVSLSRLVAKKRNEKKEKDGLEGNLKDKIR